MVEMKIKGVIFDVDGVVVYSEQVHLKTINQVLRPYGIKYTFKEHASKYIGTGAKHILAALLKDRKVKITPRALATLVSRRRQLFQKLVKKDGLRAVAGIRNFAQFVKNENLKVAFASGGHRKNVVASVKAAKLPVKKYVFVTEEEVRRIKPYPDLFLKAAKKLRLKPNQCVVIEDSPAGLVAAKRAGMKVIALLTTTPRRLLAKEKPNLIVPDFRDRRIFSFLATQATSVR
jgi:beta-phosphoglucomutase-like phosphatase (HAD superfamily)